MVRMKVDFPDPDGPKMTITSPFLTSISMPRKAWNEPNHLWTPRQWMISSSPDV
jgi:hypothetical protein